MFSDRRISIIIISACIAGWLWLLFNKFLLAQIGNPEIHTCVFKLVTGIPCPACGSTRSVLCILDGHFLEAFYCNPLGYVILPSLIVLPLWILKDRKSFQQMYQQTEVLLRKRRIAIPAITLLILNWAWNFIKLN